MDQPVTLMADLRAARQARNSCARKAQKQDDGWDAQLAAYQEQVKELMAKQ